MAVDNVSQSEALKVAVGFSPRINRRNLFVAERCLKERPISCGFQASLRDATCPCPIRGLKPTASITGSLRDLKANGHDNSPTREEATFGLTAGG